MVKTYSTHAAMFQLLVGLASTAQAQLREVPADPQLRQCVADKLKKISSIEKPATSPEAHVNCGSGGGGSARPKTVAAWPAGAPKLVLVGYGHPPQPLSTIQEPLEPALLLAKKSPHWDWSTVSYVPSVDWMIVTAVPKATQSGDGQYVSSALAPDGKSASITVRCKLMFPGDARAHLDFVLRRVPNENEEREAWGQCLYGEKAGG